MLTGLTEKILKILPSNSVWKLISIVSTSPTSGRRKVESRVTNVVDIDLTTTSTWSTAHVPSHVAAHVWRTEGAAEATTWSAIKSTTARCAVDWCGEAWLGLAILTAHQS